MTGKEEIARPWQSGHGIALCISPVAVLHDLVTIEAFQSKNVGVDKEFRLLSAHMNLKSTFDKCPIRIWP